jgi:hypothetical protein
MGLIGFRTMYLWWFVIKYRLLRFITDKFSDPFSPSNSAVVAGLAAQYLFDQHFRNSGSSSLPTPTSSADETDAAPRGAAIVRGDADVGHVDLEDEQIRFEDTDDIRAIAAPGYGTYKYKEWSSQRFEAQALMEREYLIGEFELNDTIPTNSPFMTIDPWSELQQSTFFRDKLSGFRRMRANLTVHIVSNASPLCIGAFMAVSVPPLVSPPPSMYAASSFPHEVVDVNGSQPVLFTIPWQSNAVFADLSRPSESIKPWGSIQLINVVPMVSSTGAAGQGCHCAIQVYLTLKDVELYEPDNDVALVIPQMDPQLKVPHSSGTKEPRSTHTVTQRASFRTTTFGSKVANPEPMGSNEIAHTLDDLPDSTSLPVESREASPEGGTAVRAGNLLPRAPRPPTVGISQRGVDDKPDLYGTTTCNTSLRHLCGIPQLVRVDEFKSGFLEKLLTIAPYDRNEFDPDGYSSNASMLTYPIEYVRGGAKVAVMFVTAATVSARCTVHCTLGDGLHASTFDSFTQVLDITTGSTFKWFFPHVSNYTWMKVQNVRHAALTFKMTAISSGTGADAPIYMLTYVSGAEDNVYSTLRARTSDVTLPPVHTEVPSTIIPQWNPRETFEDPFPGFHSSFKFIEMPENTGELIVDIKDITSIPVPTLAVGTTQGTNLSIDKNAQEFPTWFSFYRSFFAWWKGSYNVHAMSLKSGGLNALGYTYASSDTPASNSLAQCHGQFQFFRGENNEMVSVRIPWSSAHEYAANYEPGVKSMIPVLVVPGVPSHSPRVLVSYSTGSDFQFLNFLGLPRGPNNRPSSLTFDLHAELSGSGRVVSTTTI